MGLSSISASVFNLLFSRQSPFLWVLAILSLGSDPVAAAAKPLKVFILTGQSNMQGHAHVRTLDHLGMDPKTKPILEQLRTADGQHRVSDQVWISYLSTSGVKQGRLTAGFGANEEKIGPEWTFGIYMQQILNEPILIIKTAWGGKSLNTDFRSPSAGPYVFHANQIEQFKKQGKDLEKIRADKIKATGHYYRLMIQHVQHVLADIRNVYPAYQPDQGYELAGLVWFQGWNDMVDRGTYPQRDQPGGYDAYSEVLTHFIRDVRKDLSAPALPFVIGVMGAGGPVELYGPDQQRYKGVHQHFRQAMAAPASLAAFQGNVSAVLTENYWDMELTALRAKDAKVNQQVRKQQSEGSLNRQEQAALREKLRAEAFTAQEMEILQKGVSNAEYHYLGSAKILAGIGKGFAEAMASLLASGNAPRP